MSLTSDIKFACFTAIKNAFPQLEDISTNDAAVTVATQRNFGHYQCNAAMKIAKKLKKAPRDIANLLVPEIEKIIKLNNTLAIDKIDIAGPGFINLTLDRSSFNEQIKLSVKSKSFGANQQTPARKVIIDFSSPNVAKEMHVGHLRSTIIGESLARLFEFTNNEVVRVNHIGDWGTQFGMLIVFLENKFPSIHSDEKIDLSLKDLVEIYRAAKEKFDNDPEFKKLSQDAVVRLQGNDPQTIATWKKICNISQIGYDEIYNLLDTNKLEVKGESFYNHMLSEIVDELEEKKLVTISDGAKCVYLPGYTNRDGEPLPLIVQKSNGGFNYATTDIAAIAYRTREEKGDLLIYVVDAGQSLHFDMVFETARQAKIFNPDKIETRHVPFGLVLREDGKKFKTRSGDTERLIDLLNTAIKKASEILINRTPDMDESELKSQATQLGINAVKYADLSCNRASNYKFSYEKMLQFEGNTAAFVNYAYVRANSIIRKCSQEYTIPENFFLTLSEQSEEDVVFHLCLFPDMIEQATTELLPNRIAEYAFKLAELFHGFFHNCRVEGSEYEKERLVICKIVANTLKQCLKLLGLSPLEKM